MSRLLIPPLIQAHHHRHNQRHVHPRRDRDGIALPISQQLPRVPQLPIHMRHHLSGPLTRDLGLDVEEAAVHEQVLPLAVHGICEVADGPGAAEVELAFDFEDLGAGLGRGEVGFGEGEDFFAECEEVVAGGVVDALAGGEGEGVGGYREDVPVFEGFHGEVVVGEGKDLFFHDEGCGVLGDEGGEDGERSLHGGELNCHFQVVVYNDSSRGRIQGQG